MVVFPAPFRPDHPRILTHFDLQVVVLYGPQSTEVVRQLNPKGSAMSHLSAVVFLFRPEKARDVEVLNAIRPSGGKSSRE